MKINAFYKRKPHLLPYRRTGFISYSAICKFPAGIHYKTGSNLNDQRIKIMHSRNDIRRGNGMCLSMLYRHILYRHLSTADMVF